MLMQCSVGSLCTNIYWHSYSSANAYAILSMVLVWNHDVKMLTQYSVWSLWTTVMSNVKCWPMLNTVFIHYWCRVNAYAILSMVFVYNCDDNAHAILSTISVYNRCSCRPKVTQYLVQSMYCTIQDMLDTSLHCRTMVSNAYAIFSMAFARSSWVLVRKPYLVQSL